ncbi:MAG: thiamine pyrophosphate-dependent enzyme, partial [Elusimicrobia bacterium]|nr:thiamine pyrophosphate-dependent enzyme [Elusimicrobiota bacterium]
MSRVPGREELFRQGLLIRAVERRLLELFEQGRLSGTIHTCIGQELCAAALGPALGPGDIVVAPHRCHGHYLARTGDVEGLIAELRGRRTGASGGRGGSQHIGANGFYSSGVQGGMVPAAAGMALALKLAGRQDIVAAVIGDGTLGQGVLYETLNIASKWELPLLVVLENNLYAQSTPQSQNLAGDILSRAGAFGIAIFRADTWDHAALAQRCAEVVRRVRETGKPLFFVVDTYRLMAHSKGDDDRDPAEIEGHWEKDPLERFTRDEAGAAGPLLAEAAARVDAATAKAEAAPPAEPHEDDEDPEGFAPCGWKPGGFSSPERCAALLNAALRRSLERDPRVLVIGEDIEAPYGGAFKVTKGLSRDFPDRVRNTPISEAAIVGLGGGLAVAGFLPVVEIMFGDFLALAADQFLNQAAKFRFMYGCQDRLPLIVRTPMGGRRGYGPTHSQSLEKHFLGVPGTAVLALNGRTDPGALYDTLFAAIDRPTLVVENKLLYGARFDQPVPQGFALETSDERYPTVRLRPQGSADLTLFCYGGMLPEAEAALEALFEEHDLLCELVCPTQLYPFNAFPVLDSVRRTGRLLVVEEGQGFAALGSEVIAQVAAALPGGLKAVGRLSAARHPIPAAPNLEAEALPGTRHIVRRAE